MVTLPILVPGDIDLARNVVRSIGGMHVVTVASGPPTSGQWFAGDIATDAAGRAWVCTASGTPGTWAGPGPFFDSTLASPSATFSITGIPAGFSELYVVITGRVTAAITQGTIGLRFNGDTGSNYDVERLDATNVSAAAISALALAEAIIGVLPGASVTRASMAGTITIRIPNYSGATFEKSAVATYGMVDSTAANNSTGIFGASWRNTAAITSVTVMTTNGTTFATGTRCYAVCR